MQKTVLFYPEINFEKIQIRLDMSERRSFVFLKVFFEDLSFMVDEFDFFLHFIFT